MNIHIDSPYLSKGKKRRHQVDLIWKHIKRRLKQAGKPFRSFETSVRMDRFIDKILRKLRQTGYRMISLEELHITGFSNLQIRGFVDSHHAVWVCRRKR